jgi:DNA repair exonuclease SbcCD nuclease subunit
MSSLSNSQTLEALVFTDHHHDNQWTNGLEHADILAVEEQACDLVAVRKPHLVLFCGDRFKPHRPSDAVKVPADASLSRLAKACEQVGAHLVLLVGNHDRDTLSVSAGHTLRVVQAFPELFPCTTVIEEPATLQLSPRGVEVDVHGVPADRCVADFTFRPEAFSMLLFHDLLEGSVLDTQGKIQVRSGLRLSDVDRREFHVVLGGDNHIPQVLDFKHTKGGFVGSALGFTKADANDWRGFLYVRLTRGDAGAVSVDWERIDSVAPPIVAYETEVLDLERLLQTADPPKGAIVYVEVSGASEDLAKHSNAELAKLFNRRFPRVRHVNIVRNERISMQTRIDGLEQSSDPIQDWGVYLLSGKVDLRGLDRDRMLALGRDFLEAAR